MIGINPASTTTQLLLVLWPVRHKLAALVAKSRETESMAGFLLY